MAKGRVPQLTKKAIDWLGEERNPGTENEKDRNELNKERIYRTLSIFSSRQWLRVKKGYPHRRIAGIPGRCLSFRLQRKCSKHHLRQLS